MDSHIDIDQEDHARSRRFYYSPPCRLVRTGNVVYVRFGMTPERDGLEEVRL